MLIVIKINGSPLILGRMGAEKEDVKRKNVRAGI